MAIRRRQFISDVLSGQMAWTNSGFGRVTWRWLAVKELRRSSAVVSGWIFRH